MKNTGNVELENLTVTDEAIPAGSKVIEYLAAGDSVSWEFTSPAGDDALENVVWS